MMAATSRLRREARQVWFSNRRSRNSPSWLKKSARASALRASPLLRPAWVRRRRSMLRSQQIGRAHVCTQVTNANLVCCLLFETHTILHDSSHIPLDKTSSTHTLHSNNYLTLTTSNNT